MMFSRIYAELLEEAQKQNKSLRMKLGRSIFSDEGSSIIEVSGVYSRWNRKKGSLYIPAVLCRLVSGQQGVAFRLQHEEALSFRRAVEKSYRNSLSGKDYSARVAVREQQGGSKTVLSVRSLAGDDRSAGAGVVIEASRILSSGTSSVSVVLTDSGKVELLMLVLFEIVRSGLFEIFVFDGKAEKDRGIEGGKIDSVNVEEAKGEHNFNDRGDNGTDGESDNRTDGESDGADGGGGGSFVIDPEKDEFPF